MKPIISLLCFYGTSSIFSCWWSYFRDWIDTSWFYDLIHMLNHCHAKSYSLCWFWSAVGVQFRVMGLVWSCFQANFGSENFNPNTTRSGLGLPEPDMKQYNSAHMIHYSSLKLKISEFIYTNAYIQRFWHIYKRQYINANFLFNKLPYSEEWKFINKLQFILSAPNGITIVW